MHIKDESTDAKMPKVKNLKTFQRKETFFFQI